MTTKKVLEEKARAVVQWWNLIDTMPSHSPMDISEAKNELNDRIRALARALGTTWP